MDQSESSMDGDFGRWLERVAAGDEESIQRFWERYFERLLVVARRRYAGLPRRESDEEDVALSAMNSVLHGIRNGRFSGCDSATSLWKLLLTVTARKVCAEQRRFHAARRGGGRQRGESVFDADSDHRSSNGAGIGNVPDDELTPDVAVALHETTERLFDSLGDPQLVRIAEQTLEGYTPKEIAEELGVVPATVRRKLKLIGESLRRSSR
ncbi:MAG: ECF-type sigma factor, partial [Planctomycetia bacterium]|nr:ECF-type sigma factor [Planctomycetia bacterium]